MKAETSPLFITLEGGEGSGKSTQIKNISKMLEERGIEHIVTREPGGCENALDIRKLLVEGDPDRWDGLSELLLYNAARHEHLRRVIRPALAEGKWVLCDRFADSTIVYQSIARGIRRGVVEYITMMVVGTTWPDLTLLMDIEPEEGLKRTKGPRLGFHEDRFEKESIEFHEKLRAGYLEMAKEHKNRFRMIDAFQAPEAVFEDIKATLDDILVKGNAS